MKCPKCGKTIPDDAQFCTYCGKKFKKRKKGCLGSCSTILIIAVVLIGFLSWKSPNVRSFVFQIPARMVSFVSHASDGKKTVSQVKPTNTPAIVKNSTSNSETVDNNLRKFLEEYEAYWNDYSEYVSKYDRSDTSMVTSSEYISLLIRGADLEAKYESYESSQRNMSETDKQYYTEIIEKINTVKNNL